MSDRKVLFVTYIVSDRKALSTKKPKNLNNLRVVLVLFVTYIVSDEYYLSHT